MEKKFLIQFLSKVIIIVIYSIQNTENVVQRITTEQFCTIEDIASSMIK